MSAGKPLPGRDAVALNLANAEDPVASNYGLFSIVLMWMATGCWKALLLLFIDGIHHHALRQLVHNLTHAKTSSAADMTARGTCEEVQTTVGPVGADNIDSPDRRPFPIPN